jgi:HlyB family type I secretion system ABC transporter
MLQLSAVECGAACLAMILSYYGRQTSVAQCREDCGVGADGVTARTLAVAARSHGLRVRALSLEPDAFPRLPLPAIVHWEFNHFVVLERWSPRVVEIVDPAVGRRRLTAAEFAAGFTGVALALEPGAHFAPRRSRSAPIWWTYLRTFLAHSPGVLVQVLVASLFLQVLGLALPVATLVLVDRVLPAHLTDMLTILAVGLILVVLTELVTGYLRAALLISLQARLDSRLMLTFVEHLLGLPFRFFQQRTSGDLLLRLGSNSMIRELLTGQSISVVLDGTFVLGYLAILFARAPLLGAIALGFGVLQMLLVIGTTRRMHNLVQRDLAAQAETQSYLVETLKGIVTVKASGAEDQALEHWTNLFFNELAVALRRGQLSAFVETLMMALRSFAPLALLWVGAIQVLDGTLSLGAMLALNALAASVLTPLASLAATGQRLQLVGAHLERIADVLQAEPEQEADRVQPAPTLTGRIELRGVSFRYDPQAPLTLHDVSLAIEPGQTVALVGRTGSGKSTLAMLLLGLLTPGEGEILFDGIPIQRLDYRTVRRQCGAVLQESFLFAGSIRQNIAFNEPDLSLERLVEAAQCAAIHEEILQMPMGYETLVAEGGSRLSGGQRQRLSIARAVAHRPSILLLDEATSSLDVLTERLVHDHLSALACTRIVIAHRLSTIRDADLILVLDEGTIVERGTHAALLAQGGRYATLVRHQLEETAARRGP